ncbi:hypothetical protein HYW83_01225 [Candidatus Peregrinibacteria bacterium]|nr:hypothetical protein [Candidatus Peregrinibacteria bacterium]
MADDTNPTSGGTIDLRAGGTQTGGAAGGAASAGSAAAAGATGAASGATGGPGLFEKFDIPDTVKQQYPDLIPLILQTESMNDDERQYWFQILPIMTDEQVGKLREILMNEKNQLSALDKEYEQELKRINDKHVSEWKEFEAKEKRKKLQTAETATEKTEKEEEETLLKKLQGL